MTRRKVLRREKPSRAREATTLHVEPQLELLASMSLLASSTFSILTIVAVFNGLLLTVLALYLWHHRGRPWER